MRFIFSLRFWFVCTTTLLLILSILDQLLRTPQIPLGIISFEFHGFASEPWILDWNSQQRSLVGFNLGLDFLFIVSYSTLLWIWTSTLKRKLIRQCIQTAIITAALLDVVENFCLLQILWNGTAHVVMSKVASISASLKFFLLIVIITTFPIYRIIFKQKQGLKDKKQNLTARPVNRA
ncbi:MAG: hypothetical protein V4629_06175 [Pseudomonadota bacterium]